MGGASAYSVAVADAEAVVVAAAAIHSHAFVLAVPGIVTLHLSVEACSPLCLCAG